VLSSAAIESGVALAREAGAKVTVLAVIEPIGDRWMGDRRLAQTKLRKQNQVREEVKRHLSEAERKAKQQGVPCTVLEIEHEHAHQAIVETANKYGCDLIAMAAHARRGIAALVIGSKTKKVLSHSSIPILVYR
jgi:nucleotide-binding universal stress UspA family protein